MKIQIYGSGCNQCKQLYANAETAIRHAGIEVELEKVSDMNAIVDAGILITPALAVDGKIIAKGKVLSPDEITALLPGAPRMCNCDGKSTISAPTSGKRIVALLLLVFVALAVGTMIYRESAAPRAAAPVPADVLTVYYCIGNKPYYRLDIFDRA